MLNFGRVNIFTHVAVAFTRIEWMWFQAQHVEKFTISKRIGRRVGGLFLDIDRVFFEGFIHYVYNIYI